MMDGKIKTYVKYFFDNRYQHRDKNFANARDVRNFFEKAAMNQANRLAANLKITDTELASLILDDVIEISL